MNEFDLKMFAARTQASITFRLLALFGGLMFALLVMSFIPNVHEDKDMLAILDRIITAMLPIVGTAIGFWMARHRDTNGDNTVADKPTPAQTDRANPSQPA